MAGPIPGVNITAPRALEPYAGSTLIFSGEPPTLLIENAGTSGARTIWLQLEVGTDSNFQQIVHQADQIALGGNGRTSYRLPAPLGAGYTYYWRTRAADGANTGPYSAVSSFSVVPPVVIDAPVATAPSGKITTNKPEFKVTNGAISGTTGVAYRFEVSQSGDFSNHDGARHRVAQRQRHDDDDARRAAVQDDLLLARARQRRHERIAVLEHADVHDARSSGSHRPAAAVVAVCPLACRGVPAAEARTAARCRATARASCGPWRGRIPARSQNSCQDHGGSGSSWIRSSIRCAPTTRAGATTASAATRTIRRRMSSRITTGPDRMQNSTEVYIIDIIGGHCGPNPSPTWIDVTGGDDQLGNDRTLDQPRKILSGTVDGIRARRDRGKVLDTRTSDRSGDRRCC